MPGDRHVDEEVRDALVLRRVGVGARQADAPVAPCAPRDVHTFWPVSSQPPSARTALVRSDARSEPAPGSLNSWHQMISPRSVGGHEPLDLLGRAVLEDRRRRPPADHQIGTLRRPPRPAPGRSPAARPATASRPYGRGQCGACSPASASATWRFSVGQRGDFGDRGGDLGSQMLDRRRGRCAVAAHALLGQRGDPAQPARRAAEELRNPVCAPQVQVRVVLPGEADAAEHLDAVLGVGLGGLDADGGRDRGGDRQLRDRRRRRRRWPRRPRPPRPARSAAASRRTCA